MVTGWVTAQLTDDHLRLCAQEWRADIIGVLGGQANISTQQSALLALRSSKLLLDSIDAWLRSEPTLVNARKRALLQVVLRQTLADGLARYLSQLGLEGRRKVETVSDILSRMSEQPEGDTRQ